ncbi:dnaJ homolog subfamily C member 4 [Procambarus clarkii]|uniref:dnaJ homolog subfamily C member 4 n=1 Tax=Procambarus clarkii TaxID=6728 RepID=UPI0037427530
MESEVRSEASLSQRRWSELGPAERLLFFFGHLPDPVSIDNEIDSSVKHFQEIRHFLICNYTSDKMHSKIIEQMTFNKILQMESLPWFRYQAMRPLSSNASWKNQNHYERLKLQRNCSTTDIKVSFFRLSKEIHPDKNPNSLKHHKEFVALNEAYSVLSKPHLRLAYDAELAHQEGPKRHTHSGIVTDAPRERVIFKDESLWEMRDKSEDHKYEGRPYYGIQSINKKLPNSYIATGAVCLLIIGAVVHFFIAKKSSEFAIEKLNQRDKTASQHYMLAREQAQMNGNELQMLLFKKKTEARNHNND